MKHISWLNLIGGLLALAMAIFYFGGFAYLVKAIPLYVVMALGVALMAWDLVVSTRESAEKREADQGNRELPARR
jgi:hypothetical protein